jgi:hypothetical protein
MSEWKGIAEVPIVYDAKAILYEWDKLKAEIAGRSISPRVLGMRAAMEARWLRLATLLLASPKEMPAYCNILG